MGTRSRPPMRSRSSQLGRGSVAPAPQVPPGSLHQLGVELDTHDGAVGNGRRRHRRLVSDAAADVDVVVEVPRVVVRCGLVAARGPGQSPDLPRPRV